jgi:hypothetical protein
MISVNMALSSDGQEQWGEALRAARNLRVLTLPVLHVDEDIVDDYLEDYENSESDNEDASVEPNTTSEVEPAPDAPLNSNKIYATSREETLPSWLQPFYQPLAVFAEDFMDVYLRSPGFKELRFIHDVSPRTHFRQCRIIHFAQVLDPEHDPNSPDVSPQYMMRYLGIMEEGLEEDAALYWMPRELRR